MTAAMRQTPEKILRAASCMNAGAKPKGKRPGRYTRTAGAFEGIAVNYRRFAGMIGSITYEGVLPPA